MSRENRLQHILKNPSVWVAGRASAVEHETIPTGFESLDEKLGGGWPLGALTEILLDGQGIGELRCLMPALARLTRHPESVYSADRKLGLSAASGVAAAPWVTWVAPPHIPYPPALAQHDVDVARLLLVRTGKPIDALWAMEQALRSQACIAALGWFNQVDDRMLRRIQLAAEAGNSWAVVFRSARYLQQHSPAVLRIQLKFVVNGPVLNIVRNRFGEPGTVCLPNC
jgi:cell division inhibitor SulA/protein ImuA